MNEANNQHQSPSAVPAYPRESSLVFHITLSIHASVLKVLPQNDTKKIAANCADIPAPEDRVREDENSRTDEAV